MILNYCPSYKEYYVQDQYGNYYGGPTRRFTNLQGWDTNIDNLYWIFCGYSGAEYTGITLTNNDMMCYDSIHTYTIQADYKPQSINDVEIFVHTIPDNISIERYTTIPLTSYVDGKDWVVPKTSISNININPLSFTVTIDPTNCVWGRGFIVHIGVCIFIDDELCYFGSAKTRTGMDD